MHETNSKFYCHEFYYRSRRIEQNPLKNGGIKGQFELAVKNMRKNISSLLHDGSANRQMQARDEIKLFRETHVLRCYYKHVVYKQYWY